MAYRVPFGGRMLQLLTQTVLTRTIASHLKLKLWPSGDFSIGTVAAPKRDTSKSATAIQQHTYWNGYKDVTLLDVTTDQAIIDRYLAERFSGQLDPDKACALFEAYEQAGNYEAAMRLVEGSSGTGSPMGLSVASIRRNPPRKGLKGITTHGKRMIRSACAVMEQRYTRRLLTLVTVTVPPLPEDKHNYLMATWDEPKKRFWEEVTRLLERRGLPKDYLQVTEIQEKRYQRTGQVCLHFHGLFKGRNSSNEAWRILPSEVAGLWRRILSNHLGIDIDCTAATRIENPRKSVTRELGKYLSKGGKCVAEIAASESAELLPYQWWGMSQNLRREVVSRVIVDAGEFAVEFVRELSKRQMQGLLKFRKIYRTWQDRDTGQTRETLVGYVGFLIENRDASKLDAYVVLAS